MKEESNKNIQSERGILKCQIRSIETEGYLGDIKENENFRPVSYTHLDSEQKADFFKCTAFGRLAEFAEEYLHPVSYTHLEHHIGVYASKTDEHMVKAGHPKALLHGSLVSPSLAAAIINGKYVNCLLYTSLSG